MSDSALTLDFEAWSRCLPGRVESSGLQRLTGNLSKSTVYRIHGAGNGGSAVIAKRCPPESAVTERTIYERVLPLLPLTAPRYYGAVEAQNKSLWILLEDVEGQKFSPFMSEHRLLAARWLGILHSRSSQILPRPELPDRGTTHFHACLTSARKKILESRCNPALSAQDVAFLEAVLRLCDALEAQWPPLTRLCSSFPPTIVHGDFRPKNAYVRADPGGSRLLPMDWEMAGWGIAALDLAPARSPLRLPLVDLSAYKDTVRGTDPEINIDSIERQVRLGVVLRRLSAISWSSMSLSTEWPEKAVACIRVYKAELDDVLQRPPWAD